MSTGFTFGAKTTAPPAFGTGSITFGTPATQPTQQFGFGLKPTGFGTPASTSGGSFAFGTASSTPATGFTFGTPASSSGLTFGNPTSSAPSTGLSFGTPAAGTGLTFGGSVSSAPSTGLSFGAPASSGLSFVGTTSTPSLFGTGTSTLGAVTTSAPTIGLSFGTTSTAAPTLGLSFGAPSTSAPTLSFGLTTTGSTGFGLGGLASSTGITTAQQNVGLGGIPSTQTKPGSAVTQKEVPPKEQPLPNEFQKLVEDFKNVVQEEKNRSSDVARCSIKEFHKVEAELDALKQQFSHIETQLQNHKHEADQLKIDTARGLQNIEMAQRTQDTPHGLQYDNTAPLQFFLDLADNFEREMQILKTKIDTTDKFIKKCGEPTVLTSQDLYSALKRIHETFVALAARLHSVHSQVENQKEVFLSLRRQAVKDNVNPFENMNKTTENLNTIVKNVMKNLPPIYGTGPTPFNSITLSSNNLTLAAEQKPALNNTFGR